MTQWISVNDRLPEKKGKYLCYQESIYEGFIRVCSFALNLEQVDEYDFHGEKRCGWYDYDSEYGYYEHTDVIYWMPLPEPPEILRSNTRY